MASRMLTTREAAEELGLKPNTVSQHAKAGVFPFAVDVGVKQPGSKQHRAVWRFDPDGLEAWKASRSAGDTWRAAPGAKARAS